MTKKLNAEDETWKNGHWDRNIFPWKCLKKKREETPCWGGGERQTIKE